MRKYRQHLIKNENLNWYEIVDKIPTTDGPESDLLWREISSIYRSDLNLVVSPFEINLLTEKYQIPKNKLFLSQFYYQKNNQKLKEFNQRKDFFMIGNFNHEPNYDSFEYLKKHLWPKIHEKLPESRMFIYGSLMKKECKEWEKDDPSFKLVGHLKDLNKIQDFRAQLAPLRFGAGIKGKITDSWFHGTPVVTTFIGTEGMKIENDRNVWGGFEAKDEKEFIEMSIELYKNEKVWKEKQEIGSRIMRELFDEDDNFEKLIKELKKLIMNYKEKRKYDVTQSLLWNTNMRITEIKSRAIIQKKNKIEKN